MITIGIVDNDRFALPMLDMPLTDIPGPEICRRVRAASATSWYLASHRIRWIITVSWRSMRAPRVDCQKRDAEGTRRSHVECPGTPFPGFPTTEQHMSIVSASARRSRTLSKREREVLGLYADNYSTA